MSSLTYIVYNGDGTEQSTSTNPNEGRVIGIQTRIPESLCRQAGLSSPFHQPPSAAVQCGIRLGGQSRCVLDHGHAGAHVYETQKTEDQSANTLT